MSAAVRGRRETQESATTMMTPQEITERIQGAIPGAEVDVIDTMGDAQHWRVLVTSSTFDGLSLIEQHKLVMGSLQDEIGGRMHAVEIKTMLPGAAGP